MSDDSLPHGPPTQGGVGVLREVCSPKGTISYAVGQWFFAETIVADL